jgi:hypothetical protein
MGTVTNVTLCHFPEGSSRYIQPLDNMKNPTGNLHTQ